MRHARQTFHSQSLEMMMETICIILVVVLGGLAVEGMLSLTNKLEQKLFGDRKKEQKCKKSFSNLTRKRQSC